jgi:hypothetical protein
MVVAVQFGAHAPVEVLTELTEDALPLELRVRFGPDGWRIIGASDPVRSMGERCTRGPGSSPAREVRCAPGSRTGWGQRRGARSRRYSRSANAKIQIEYVTRATL